MTSESDELELLFFETFSHEASGEINLDLVQFPKPVVIGEVRIIPLGARVQADFPGGVRLGATNPSQFKIEFFVNDLSKPGASTFENLGSIDYNQNGNIHMECEQKITTDGLVLRGWYTTITLAVYGALSKATESNSSQVSLQDPASSQQPDWHRNQMRKEKYDGSHYTSYPSENFHQDFSHYSWSQSQSHGEFEATRMNCESDPNWELREEKHWNKDSYSERSPVEYPREHNTPEYDGPRRRDPAHYPSPGWEWSKRPRSPPPTPPPQQPTPPPPPPREEAKEERTNTTSKPFEPLLSPGDVESISDGDIVEEPIDQFSDDEDDIELELPDYPFQEMDEDIPEGIEEIFKEFDPFTFEIKPLKVLKSPIDEWSCRKPENSVQMANVISSVRDPRQERLAWVEAVDDLLALLPSTINDSYIEDKLVEWTEVGCSWPAEEAEPTVRVRHAKAGVRLAEAAAASGLSPRLVRAGIHHALLDLYDRPHMAHSIRAMALRALDSIANEPIAAAEMVTTCRDRGESVYMRLLRTLQNGRPVAAKAPAVPLVTKIHFSHLLDTLSSLVKDKMSNIGTTYECLMEIYRVYREAPRLLCQPIRFLPVSSLFSLPPCPDPTLTLYSHMTAEKLGDSLAIALDAGPQIVAPVAALIACMADRWDGLRYLTTWDHVLTALKRAEPGLAAGVAVRLAVVSAIDSILADSVADKDSVVESLRLLFNLASSPATQFHCLAAIAFHEPLRALLALLGQRPCQKRKSPSRGYITDLIKLLVIHHPSPEYLINHVKELSSASSDFPELSSISDWLKPALTSPIVYDNFDAVYDFVKKNIENSVNLPGELTTAVRILRWLVIPGYENNLISVSPEFKELKYKYALLNIYSLGGLSDFVNILKRLTSRFDQPIIHAPNLCGKDGLHLLALVLPIVQIIRRILILVIQRRGTEFKDMTAVPVLLKMFNLLMTLSTEAQAEGDVKIACQEIIETLLGYTQVSSSEGTLGKSLWTQLIQEVIKWTMDLPMNFVSGCVVLSQLLPLPLPVRSVRNLSQDEVSQLVNWRKLWSAHVHAASCVEELAATLCMSGHQPLVEALRRVCLQLADLGAPTAVSLARALLDAIAEAGPHRPRALAFLGTLAAHPPVKVALVHLLVPDPPKVDDKYLSLFLSMFESANCLEGLLSIIQPLCYTNISVTPGTSQLPPKEFLLPVCEAMARHLSPAETSVSSILSILRIFCLLSDSDYGLYYTKQGLSAAGAGILRIVLERSTDQGVAGWCVALGCALSAASRANDRSSSLSRSDLAALFAFDKESPSSHPLSTLLDKAKSESDANSEDEARKLTKENLETLLKILKGETENETKDVVEVSLGEVKDAMWLFTNREVYVKSDSVDLEQLSPSYWLSPPYDRSYIDPNKDLVTVDLTEVAEKELTGWKEAVAELWEKGGSEEDRQREQPGSEVMPGQQGDKQPFVAPKLGRGGGTVGGSGDAFRSRPPNTSRPPSLHVDDFVALETCGAQPTGPTGYNKLSMRAAQDLLGLRGGMRSNPGRMTMPPPPDRGMRFFGQSYHLPPPHLPPFPFYHHHF